MKRLTAQFLESRAEYIKSPMVAEFLVAYLQAIDYSESELGSGHCITVQEESLMELGKGMLSSPVAAHLHYGGRRLLHQILLLQCIFSNVSSSSILKTDRNRLCYRDDRARWTHVSADLAN